MRSSGPLTDRDREAIARFRSFLDTVGPMPPRPLPAWKRYEIRLAYWRAMNRPIHVDGTVLP